jgi:hypothetical protein
MFRQRRLTIPANTLFEDPAILKLSVPAGMIDLITVEFPSGCHDNPFVQILQSSNPVFPDEQNEGITGNDVTLQIPMTYVLESGKNELTLKGWSPGSEKPHIIAIGISVFSEAERSREEEYLKSMNLYLKGIAQQLGIGGD